MKLPEKVELYCESVDMRKGYQGLVGLIETSLKKDSLNGVLYLFTNRSRSLIKGVYWDRTGYLLISKKLSNGKFCIPLNGCIVELESSSFRLLLDGLKVFC